MAKYYVKVVADGDNFRVLANLPSGVFSSQPMPEEQAVELAITMKKLNEGEPERSPLWKRILRWRKRSSPDVPSSPPGDPPVCPRHPQWIAEWADGKWVCGFCRKDLRENVETVRG